MKRDYAASQIRLTPEVSVFFRSFMIEEIRKQDGFTYSAMFPIFSERMDVDEMPIIMPACENYSREFHACISVAGQLLPMLHAKNFVYEGEADVTINPRGVIQNTARWYGVDPSATMTQWSVVRTYLAHSRVQLPETLEAGLLKQEQVGNANVRNYH